MCIFDEAILENDNSIPNVSIIHYTNTLNKSRANDKNVKSIQSTGWDLAAMYPGEGHHYAYGDTWIDMF